MAILLETFEALLRECQPDLEPMARRDLASKSLARSQREASAIDWRLQAQDPGPEQPLKAVLHHLMMQAKFAEEVVLDQPGGRDPRAGSDQPRGSDYRITADDALGQAMPLAKARANVAAIALVKHLEQEGRGATAEEQRSLVQYVSWGETSIATKVWPTRGSPEGGWAKVHGQLEELLTGEEFEAARRSTQYAHYTSPEAIDGMWHAMESMGFKGARALEPGGGIAGTSGASCRKRCAPRARTPESSATASPRRRRASVPRAGGARARPDVARHAVRNDRDAPSGRPRAPPGTAVPA
jgi:hypothetical protein